MYHSHGRDKGHSRSKIGRSPPRRRRSTDGENKFCIYCEVQVSSAQLYKEHQDTAVHKQKEIVIRKAISDGSHYCYTCDKVFPSKLTLDAHCLMTRHKPLYRMDELQRLHNNPGGAEIPLVDPLNQDSRRAKENKERQDIVLKLNQLRGDGESFKKASVENEKIRYENSYFCELCSVDCMNQSNYKIHIESWRHRAESDKSRDEMAKQAKKKLDQVQKDKKVEVDESRKVPEHLAEKAGYFCEVCSVPSSSESAYLDHLRNRKHFRQVGLMRRPYKCYFCNMEFNIAKDFNYHLESSTHMDKAFNKRGKPKIQEKRDEWVEKDLEKGKNKRDGRKEDIYKSPRYNEKQDHHDYKSKDEHKDSLQVEGKESSLKNVDGRKVEIVNDISSAGDDIKDLREKLKSQKILITKSNTPEVHVNQNANKNEILASAKEANESIEVNKEKDFENAFNKMVKEFGNDIASLRVKLTRDREEDIGIYQKYEAEYQELCQEEEFIRRSLDSSSQVDEIQKEEFFHDLLRIQSRMQKVHEELATREMKIIKRENLFRASFPDYVADEKVTTVTSDPVVYDYNHGNMEAVDDDIKDDKAHSEDKNNPDLRIQLERERLMKRLGPELESIDPNLREKLVSVIFETGSEADSFKDGKEPKLVVDKRQIVKDDIYQKKKSQMEKLSEREKQLKKELAELKSNDKKIKLTKSLVSQYDDVVESKEFKKRARKRSVSSSSESSHSSSSTISEDSDDKSYRKKRKSSLSKSSSKYKQRGSNDKNRRKRRRSSSSERDRKKRTSGKRGRDERRKSYRSKNDKRKSLRSPAKSSEKGKEKKMQDTSVIVDSDIEEVKVISGQPISVVGSVDTRLPVNQKSSQLAPNLVQNQSMNHPTFSSQRKEQFSCWKNQVAATPSTEDSPKEDVWDIAFSGAQKEEPSASSALNLFDTSNDSKQLPADILSILKSVAPIFQNKSFDQRCTVISSTAAKSMSESHSNSIPYTSSSSYSYEQERLEPLPPQSKDTNSSRENQEEKDGVGKIRSILKKVKDQPLISHQLYESSARNRDSEFSFIPGLDSSPFSENSLSVSRKDENKQQSILRSCNNDSTPNDHMNTIKSLPNKNTTITSSVGNLSRYNPSLSNDIVSQYPHPEIDAADYNESLQKEKSHTDGSISESVITSNEESHAAPYAAVENRVRFDHGESNLNYKREPFRGSEQTDFYYDGYGMLPGKNRDEKFISPLEKPISYDSEQVLRGDRDLPHSRKRVEVRHQVIDYHYVRDTQVIPADGNYDKHPVGSIGPRARHDIQPSVGVDDRQPPERFPGETDDEYYARFERFYAMRRRSEENQEDVRREKEIGLFPARFDAGRSNPDSRAPIRNDIYRPVSGNLPDIRKNDVFDGRYPSPLDNRSLKPPSNYIRPREPFFRREEIASSRRAEYPPYENDGRDVYSRHPYKHTETPSYRRPELADPLRSYSNDPNPPMRENFRMPNIPNQSQRFPTQSSLSKEYLPKFQDKQR